MNSQSAPDARADTRARYLQGPGGRGHGGVMGGRPTVDTEEQRWKGSTHPVIEEIEEGFHSPTVSSHHLQDEGTLVAVGRHGLMVITHCGNTY